MAMVGGGGGGGGGGGCGGGGGLGSVLEPRAGGYRGFPVGVQTVQPRSRKMVEGVDNRLAILLRHALMLLHVVCMYVFIVCCVLLYCVRTCLPTSCACFYLVSGLVASPTPHAHAFASIYLLFACSVFVFFSFLRGSGICARQVSGVRIGADGSDPQLLLSYR